MYVSLGMYSFVAEFQYLLSPFPYLCVLISLTAPMLHFNCHARMHKLALLCETMSLCRSVTHSHTHPHTHTNFSANTSNVNSYNKLSDIHHPHTVLLPLSLLQTHILSEEQYDIHKEIKMPEAHEKSIQPRRRKRPQRQLCAPYSSSSSSLPTINSELQQPCYKSLYHFHRSLVVFSRILPLILYSRNPASTRERGSPGLTPDKFLSF